MKECNIRFDKNGKVKSEDIKNLEKFFSEENLEKFESDEVFAVEATEHLGNGEYKKIGYDFCIGSDTQARQGSDWRFGYIAFCNYWCLVKNNKAVDFEKALERAKKIILTNN
jgi:uncharacterized metal-binding protein